VECKDAAKVADVAAGVAMAEVASAEVAKAPELPVAVEGAARARVPGYVEGAWMGSRAVASAKAVGEAKARAAKGRAEVV
jgi:hypothetical protein